MQPTANVAIVVVTYNRPDFLRQLLASLQAQSVAPRWIIVVDNASSDHTPEVVAAAAAAAEGSRTPIVSLPQPANIGGAGGFSVGVSKAVELGADWLWLMDDDVEALPSAVEVLLNWGERFKCIHGRRYDANGQPFFFQPVFSEWLGVPLPRLGDPFADADHITINAGCFEGMFVHRTVVEQVGLPDPRFFITWDDAVYGWLASRITPVVLVNDFVLKRLRQQRQISLGIRHLNDSSDLSRFHVMRNRAYVANYFAQAGVFRPFGFALGTMLTAFKELTRIVAIERRAEGVIPLWRGWRAARRIRREKNWRPMPQLAHQQTPSSRAQ
ncbi:glycosyltransferase family 2 protein [Devosia sp. 1566]|uniref:glycosyltransferase family 2 protein n=1 Tax=Devosia sp. 1566 TaxID=2499144 RepID=UPI000FDC1AFB|nr:glycosyltransferase family 2 protein [Devosia sp. 1566]